MNFVVNFTRSRAYNIGHKDIYTLLPALFRRENDRCHFSEDFCPPSDGHFCFLGTDTPGGVSSVRHQILWITLLHMCAFKDYPKK